MNKERKKMKYDVITIGSSTIDVFLTTEKNMFHLIRQRKKIEICFDLGRKIEVKDIKFYTGGGGTNSAVCLARLGLKVAYIGKLGNDASKNIILEELKKEKVDFLGKIDKNLKTGYSVVLDAKGKDRTILAYKGANNNLRFEDIKDLNTEYIYLSSMMGLSYKTSEKIAINAGKRGVKILFNPSSYLAKKGVFYLRKILKNTYCLICNKEEGMELTSYKIKDMRKLLQTLYDTGPRIVVLTDGPNTINCFDGKCFYSVKPKKTKVIETTGAGDAFAATFLSGLIEKRGSKDVIEHSLKKALINSESVLMYYGAKNKLLNREKINKKMKKTKTHIKKRCSKEV